MTANPFTDMRKNIARAIADPGATEGYKGDRSLTQWQTDAVLSALSAAVPADLAEAGKLADECYEAVSGEGPRAFDWTDKPHRLVYDMYDTIRSLIALATAQAARIEAERNEKFKMRDERDKAKIAASNYADFNHTWRKRAEAAEAALAAERAKLVAAMQHVMDYSNDPHLVQYARAAIEETGK